MQHHFRGAYIKNLGVDKPAHIRFVKVNQINYKYWDGNGFNLGLILAGSEFYWLMQIDADRFSLVLINAYWFWLLLIGAACCWLILIYSDWFWLMQNYADLCMIDADWCWWILIGADWCWLMLMSAYLIDSERVTQLVALPNVPLTSILIPQKIWSPKARGCSSWTNALYSGIIIQCCAKCV